MNKSVKFILKTISSLIVLVALVLAMLLVGLKFVGFQIYTVVSGSMEPNYHVGSLIYVKEIEPEILKVGDSITFKLGDNTIATHRIIEIVYDELDNTKYSFRTKGDANENPDANLVEPNKVLGKAYFTIPYLGYLATYIQGYPGNIVAICVSISLIIIVVMLDAITEDKEKKVTEEAPPAEENNQPKKEKTIKNSKTTKNS